MGRSIYSRFDPKGADLSLLNNGAPVLADHDTSGVAAQKGVVQKAWADGGLYKATLRFSKRPDVDGLWQDIKDKIVQKFSMGVEILVEHELSSAAKTPIRLADKWRPFELSCVALPADFGTTTLSRASYSAAMAAYHRQREIDVLRLK